MALKKTKTPSGAASLTIRDVAQMTGVKIDTLKYLQLTDMGPAYTEERGYVRYSVEAVRKFQAIRAEAHSRLARRLVESAA